MIMFVCFAAMVGGIVWNAKAGYCSWEDNVSFAMSLAGGIGAVASVVILIFCNVGVEGEIAACKQEYEMLVYQLENNLYDNDNDIGKKELMNQIQAWNIALARNRAIQRDFWIGVFVPNIYDQFEYINVGGRTGG